MIEITKEQQEQLSRVLKDNNLIEKINLILLENGLTDFTVKTIQLQYVDVLSTLKDCPDGFELQWICHDGPHCELKCMPIG